MPSKDSSSPNQTKKFQPKAQPNINPNLNPTQAYLNNTNKYRYYHILDFILSSRLLRQFFLRFLSLIC